MVKKISRVKPVNPCDCCSWSITKSPARSVHLINFASGDGLFLCDNCLNDLTESLKQYKEAKTHDHTQNPQT